MFKDKLRYKKVVWVLVGWLKEVNLIWIYLTETVVKQVVDQEVVGLLQEEETEEGERIRIDNG